jgi:hypothetical protein
LLSLILRVAGTAATARLHTDHDRPLLEAPHVFWPYIEQMFDTQPTIACAVDRFQFLQNRFDIGLQATILGGRVIHDVT